MLRIQEAAKKVVPVESSVNLPVRLPKSAVSHQPPKSSTRPKPCGVNFLSQSNVYARDLPSTPFVLLFGPGLWKSSMQGPLCLTDPSLLQAKPSGKSDEDGPAPRKGPFYKTRADFLSRRERQRLNK